MGTGLLRRLPAVFLEALFPGRCLVCGRRLPLIPPEPAGGAPVCDAPICGECLAGLQPLSGRRCRVCSAPLLSEEGTCLPCRQRSYAFRSHHAIFEYRGIVKELIYQYKFQYRRRLAPLFARLLAGELARLHPGLPVIPVPSRRGFRLAEAGLHLERIARLLERRHGVPVRRVLRRRGRTPQKSLSFEERRRNIRGAVSLAARARPWKEAGAVVLLDDVFTTGATADECARVLAGAGCAEVYVLTLAMD